MTGQATFEWLDDQQFLIQRSHYDHPEIPDAIAVTGLIDGKPSMHYFDPRGVHRVFAVDITADTWRFWNDTPLPIRATAGTSTEPHDPRRDLLDVEAPRQPPRVAVGKHGSAGAVPAHQHAKRQGTLTLTPRAAGGLCVTVQLPVAPPHTGR